MAPVKFIQTKNLLVVLYEEAPPRQVFLDGRPLPKDPNPTWMGYSLGRWDGDTLVIETAGYNDRTWLDLGGHPHTEALRVIERFRRVDTGRMRMEMTFEDPQTYTRPWTLQLTCSSCPTPSCSSSSATRTRKAAVDTPAMPLPSRLVL